MQPDQAVTNQLNDVSVMQFFNYRFEETEAKPKGASAVNADKRQKNGGQKNQKEFIFLSPIFLSFRSGSGLQTSQTLKVDRSRTIIQSDSPPRKWISPSV